MKQFFKWMGKHIAGALVFSLFSILFIAGIVYALTYPSAPPVGEVAGGKFMQYFNSIKVACPDGYYLNGYDVNFVKQCKLAPAGVAGANGIIGTPTRVSGTSGAGNGGSITVTCPVGKKLLSGGVSCNAGGFWGTAGSMLQQSYPSGEGWYGQCWTVGGVPSAATVTILCI